MESPGTRGLQQGTFHGHDGWAEKLRDRYLQKGSRISAGGLLGIKPGINKVRDNLVYIGPSFIHDFGDSAHHMSMMRTVEREIDEYGDEADYIPGTGPSNLRFWFHELLDDYFFYSIQRWISHWVGGGKLASLLRDILGFFWGFNCGFPPRDIALYTIWRMRGHKPLAEFRKVGGQWTKI